MLAHDVRGGVDGGFTTGAEVEREEVGLDGAGFDEVALEQGHRGDRPGRRHRAARVSATIAAHIRSGTYAKIVEFRRVRRVARTRRR